jgi:hypothetical protein
MCRVRCRCEAAARTTPEEAVARAWAEGKAMTLEEAAAYVLSEPAWS